MTKLPVLQPQDLFSFACPEDVRAMPEKGAGHFCATCDKTVVDLSRRTYGEAVATLRSAKKGLCVSYSVAQDGNLVFRDLVKGTVVVTVAAFMAACANPEPAQSPPERAETRIAMSSSEDTNPIEVPAPTTSDERRYPGAVAELEPPSSEGSGTAAPRWPSAVTETPPSPPLVRPVRGRPAPPPRPIAGKPAPLPEHRPLAGEPMVPVAGTMMEVK